MKQRITDHFPGWQDRMFILALAVVIMMALSVVPVTAGAVKFTDVATGHGLSVALTDDGKVWTWGNALHGALGINTSNNTASPQLTNLSHVADVAAGSAHVLALMDNGTVFSWGYNNYGQLGDGTTEDRYLPVQVSGLDHVKAVAAGLLYSVALKDDGTVWAWGYNNYGQLGTGAFSRYEPVPVRVAGLSGIVRLYAGYNHNVAVDGSGNAWAWGANDCGELGDGTTVSQCTPERLDVLAGVRDIALGSSYTIVLDNDGTVRAWGENLQGWLGDGTATTQLRPVAVTGPDHVTAVFTGEGISFAVRDDGTVMAWGMNSAGLIGNGIRDQRVYQAAKADNLNGITRFTVGDAHVLGIKADGSLWAWGDNQFGEMGIGTFVLKTFVPTRISIGDTAQVTSQPTAVPDNAGNPGNQGNFSNVTDDTPAAPADNSRYVMIGAIALIVLVIGAGAVVWYSRK